MKKSTSRIVGLVMLIIAVAFIVFALNHPEMSFPWNNSCSTAAIGLKIRRKPQWLQPMSEFLIARQEMSATFKQHICDMQFNVVAVA